MPKGLAVLSLFSGAGGLDLGLEAAGFATRLCVENDNDARATLALNRPSWPLAEPSDAIEFAKDPLATLRTNGLRRAEISLLAGGPPCQPFSKAGYWTKGGPRRMKDPRASGTIQAYLRIVRAVRPDALLFENVAAFAFRGRDEGFTALARGISRINRDLRTQYEPQLVRVNAADYGVPQVRERVFIIAHRRGKEIRLPPPTHGPKSPDQRPYTTAWDAIGHLDGDAEELAARGRWAELLPSIPEGKNYLWHTPKGGGRPLFGWRTRYWSFLLKLAKNQPSWTIPASPGPAIGPFHWRSRLLSATELALLQAFPESYRIFGDRRSAQRQVGNAVPAALAEFVGLEIRRQLFGDRSAPRQISLLPKARADCPAAEVIRSVPKGFLHLLGDHRAHPGTGKGPARTSNITRS